MIDLDKYSLDNVPDYCLYSKDFSAVCGQPKFGLIYTDPNTKFGYLFKIYHKILSKRVNDSNLSQYKPFLVGIHSRQLYTHLKQIKRIQGLKDGKGYREFHQWMQKELGDIHHLIWFTSYRYLEEFYDGTLWSNSKNIH